MCILKWPGGMFLAVLADGASNGRNTLSEGIKSLNSHTLGWLFVTLAE